MTREFFRSLYEKEKEVFPQEILDHIERKISDDINTNLTRPFSAVEVSDALFQIGPLKAPGADGFPAQFF